jgi:hypothetical protein
MDVKEDAIGLSGFVVARAYRGVVTLEDGTKDYSNAELLWEEKGANIIPDVGLTYILQSALTNEASAITTLYVGLLDNYTPVAASTMTEAGGNEITNYSASVRQTWVGVEGTQTATNTASPASFTISTGGATVYGAFLSDASTQGGTTGTLVAAKLFSSSRELLEDDVLNVTYEVSASSS